MEQISEEAVTEVIEGQKRFDVYLRMAEAYRNDVKAIGNLWTVQGPRSKVPRAADL